MTTPQDDLIYTTAALVCAVAGAIFDVRSRRVPNFLTGPALLFGLALHTTMNGWRGLGAAFAAALICGGIFFILFAAGGMGAGDVKLIAAVGCIAGPSHAAYILVLTGLAGGAMALVMIMRRQRVRETLANVGTLFMHHGQHGLQPHSQLNVKNENALRLPYAVAIAAGTALMCLLVIQR